MVERKSSTNKKHKLYNSTIQAVSRGGGDCATKVRALCAHFVNMGSLVKTQVENGLCNFFDLHCHTIDVSDQAVVVLKD